MDYSEIINQLKEQTGHNDISELKCPRCEDTYGFIDDETRITYNLQGKEDDLSCEEEFISSDSYIQRIDGRQETICHGCVESIEEYGNHVSVVDEKGLRHVIVDGEYVADIEACAGDSDPVLEDYEDEIKAIAKCTHWVSFNAWRGTTVVCGKPAMVRVLDMQMLWGDASERINERICVRSKEAFLKAGIPLFAVNSHTSNCLVRNIDLLVRTSDAERAAQIVATIENSNGTCTVEEALLVSA